MFFLISQGSLLPSPALHRCPYLSSSDIETLWWASPLWECLLFSIQALTSHIVPLLSNDTFFTMLRSDFLLHIVPTCLDSNISCQAHPPPCMDTSTLHLGFDTPHQAAPYHGWIPHSSQVLILCAWLSLYINALSYHFCIPTPHVLSPLQGEWLWLSVLGYSLPPHHLDAILTLFKFWHLMSSHVYVCRHCLPHLSFEFPFQSTPLHECLPPFFTLYAETLPYVNVLFTMLALRTHMYRYSLPLVQSPTPHTRLPFHEESVLILLRILCPMLYIPSMSKFSSACYSAWPVMPYTRLSFSIVCILSSYHVRFYNVFWYTISSPTLMLTPTFSAPPLPQWIYNWILREHKLGGEREGEEVWVFNRLLLYNLVKENWTSN